MLLVGFVIFVFSYRHRKSVENNVGGSICSFPPPAVLRLFVLILKNWEPKGTLSMFVTFITLEIKTET